MDLGAYGLKYRNEKSRLIHQHTPSPKEIPTYLPAYFDVPQPIAPLRPKTCNDDGEYFHNILDQLKCGLYRFVFDSPKRVTHEKALDVYYRLSN